MKKVSLLLLSLIVCASLAAQEAVSTAGNSHANSSVQIDYTVGQLAIMTHSSSSVIVTQGFHQTFAEMVEEPEVLASSEGLANLKVFPNPTQDKLTIQYDSDQFVTYFLYNLQGQVVLTDTFTAQTDINITKFSKGLYQLILKDQEDKLVQTFKVQFL